MGTLAAFVFVTMLRFFIVLSLVLASFANATEVRELIYPPSTAPGELKMESHFYLWLPPGVAKVRGIVVHQHGCGTGSETSGMTGADDLHWQALAAKWDFALVSTSYKAGDKEPCGDWCDARNGSDAKFQQALADFAKETKHPELTSVPWCLWGHSGGGVWVSLMLAAHPERVVAVWCRSGTALADATIKRPDRTEPVIPEAAYGVPVMANTGIKEKDDKRFHTAWETSHQMHLDMRAKGAPIGVAPDPRTSHQCGDQRYAAIAFFDTCLAMRLPVKNGEPLKPVDQSGAWLAEVDTDAAVPAAEFKGDKTKSVWLPNEAFAKVWMEYVKTGTVGDTTPPPAPTGVKVTGNEITWEATADLESGLGGFIIERDGKTIATLPEKPDSTFGRPLFQSMTYSDTPKPPLAEMKYVDKEATPAAKYHIIAVNSAGLKSK
ncbi:MAG: hypothetical protein JWO94_3205 [Verrucomicrobiaceae bacterium]|nr:hypothetical protein [Verrucomicrobiaceae bacterium]